MRRTKWLLLSWSLCAASSWAGCSVSAGNGGNGGSIFPDRDAATTDAASKDEDSGSTGEDGGQVSVDASADGGTASTQPGDAPALLATAVCGALRDCLGAQGLLDYLNGSPCEDYVTKQQGDRDLHWLPESVQASRVSWNPSRIAQCQADLRAFGCQVQSRRLPASCKQAIQGKVAVNGSCSIDYDCEGTAYCDKSASPCPGVCTAPQAIGRPCTASRECADMAVCRSGMCVALLQDGDPCEQDAKGAYTCPPGLTCTTTGSSHVCQANASVFVGKENDACDALVMLCEPGLVCASTTGTMGVCAKLAAMGGSCKRAKPSQCPTGQLCDATAAGATGTCVDLPGAGMACLRGTSCAPGNVCIQAEGACHAMATVGEACVDSAQCYSGTCTQGQCAAALQCTF